MDKIIEDDIKVICSEIDEDSFKNKKILITGGAGFIGSWLCDIFIQLGANVTCLDNLSSSTKKNIDNVLTKKGFRFIQEDIKKFNSKEKYDFILHLASKENKEEYQMHPIETLLMNSTGTYLLLEMARKMDSKFLFTSTNEVYGHAQIIPTPETYWGYVDPIGKKSSYEQGKRFGEALITAYNTQYGIDSRIIRIFDTYGPRMRLIGKYPPVISNFIIQALRGKDIMVYGNGSQTRSFCYIRDTIQGILLAITKEAARGEVINIGDPDARSILEVANKIKQIIRSNSRIIFQDLPEGYLNKKCPDITKAERILEWKPKTEFGEGLYKTINWLRHNISIND